MYRYGRFLAVALITTAFGHLSRAFDELLQRHTRLTKLGTTRHSSFYGQRSREPGTQTKANRGFKMIRGNTVQDSTAGKNCTETAAFNRHFQPSPVRTAARRSVHETRGNRSSRSESVESAGRCVFGIFAET